MTINLTDPANHPANSPLTGERIERAIEALESSLKYRNGSTMDHFIADAVKGLRELRESREAQNDPVMYCSAETIAAARDGEHLLRTLSAPSGDCFIPLFIAPPAPVVPEEKRDDDGNTTSEFDHGWNAFRAAMLQSFGHSEQLEPVSETERMHPNSFTDAELEAMAHDNNPQANAYRQALTFRRNSPVTPDGWRVEAERLAELHGCSFVVFRHGGEPQCADPTKVIISFTDKGLGYAEDETLRGNVNSSTKHLRENSETSTNCPKCGGHGTYHCPQMLGTVECECALPTAPKKAGNNIREDMKMGGGAGLPDTDLGLNYHISDMGIPISTARASSKFIHA
ncbi:hypothetical protein [Kluyvera sichuanensis]|uniref:hypothetical protein n=1 Tax=Kluyvera sichuanensis TaxID=2725494 RepID=UPI002FD41E53